MRKADVLAALKRLGVQARCSVCQANSWGGIGKEGAELAAHVQAIDLDGEITPGAGLECAALICTNCGYIRLHALQVLQKR